MKIALVTPTPPDISSFGVRALSALLKREGIDVRCLFLPGGIERLRHGGDVVYQYSAGSLDDISAVVKAADVIGVSFMSQYRDRAIALTHHLRRVSSAPILWGGVHASVRPDDALDHADGVCIGEGDVPLLELCKAYRDGRDHLATPSFFFRTKAGVRRNPIAPPVADLDQLPPVDFSLDGHFLLDPLTGRVAPMSASLLEKTLPLMPYFSRDPVKVYRTMTSRGCPHRCTYCANRHQSELAAGAPHLRWRSVGHVISELQDVLRRHPFIQGVHFFDDVFAAMPMDRLTAFCQSYRDEIRLPFYCQVSPSVLSRERLDLLLDAGMVFIEMGVQTGSARVRQMYDRPESNEQIMDAAKLIHSARGRTLTPRYHLILDNPWETLADRMATIDFASRLPRPFIWCLSSLVLYPGTALNELAHQQGMIEDEETGIYRRPFYKVLPNLGNLLVTLTDVPWIPPPVIRWLNRPRIIQWGDSSAFRPLAAAGIALRDYGRIAWKGLRALLRGDLRRISAYLNRTR